MTPRKAFTRSFVRKVVYAIIIGLLMIPLFFLGQPATSATKDSPGVAGGQLARMREQYHLGQAKLGQVDPASITVKLATLGLRGVAANLLWEKATEYEKKKDWTKLTATLNQITKVQPNFISVWIYQGWNMSYNVSVAFDDYHERYRWVIKGFEFLKEGLKYNEAAARLTYELGWNTYWKIGRSDEKKQFRRLFKEDNDYHQSTAPALRDNFLVAKRHHADTERMVDTMGAKVMGKNPLMYRSATPMMQMYYALGVEGDGTFGEVAKRAWAGAEADWHTFGQKDIPSTYAAPDGAVLFLRLGEKEAFEKKIKELMDQIYAMEPGLAASVKAERLALLSESQRAALDKPAAERSAAEAKLAREAQDAMEVSLAEIARRIKEPQRTEARAKAKQADEYGLMIHFIENYRSIINFDYWRLHAEVEQTDDMLNARRLLYQGSRSFSESDFVAARNAFVQGFEYWRKTIDAHQDLLKSEIPDEGLMDGIKCYRQVLDQLDEPFPDPFILQDVVNLYDPQNTRGTSKKQEPSGLGL